MLALVFDSPLPLLFLFPLPFLECALSSQNSHNPGRRCPGGSLTDACACIQCSDHQVFSSTLTEDISTQSQDNCLCSAVALSLFSLKGQCSTMTDVPCVGDMWENHFGGGLWVAVCRRACQPQNTTHIFLCWYRCYGVPLLLPQLSEKTDIWFIGITRENFYLFGKTGRSILLSPPFVNTTSNGKNVQVEISESKGISQAGQQRQRSFSLWKTGIIVLNDL